MTCILTVNYGKTEREREILEDTHTHIYISIVIHRQICFVLSELVSVARQYIPIAGIKTQLTQTPSPSF